MQFPSYFLNKRNGEAAKNGGKANNFTGIKKWEGVRTYHPKANACLKKKKKEMK